MQGKPITEQAHTPREGEVYCMLFHGNIRKLPFNPFKAETVFGHPQSMQDGDVFAENEYLLARLEAYEAALREIVAPCKVEDPWEMLNDIVDIARKALGDA